MPGEGWGGQDKKKGKKDAQKKVGKQHLSDVNPWEDPEEDLPSSSPLLQILSGGHLKPVTLKPVSRIFRIFRIFVSAFPHFPRFPRFGSVESPQTPVFVG